MVIEKSEFVFDPFDSRLRDDPYPAYRRLRDESPVHHVEVDDLWVVTRHEHCTEILRNPTAFSSKTGIGRLMSGGLGKRAVERIGDAAEPLQFLTDLRVLIALDPPDHKRLRRLVNRPFTPREIGVHEDRIRQLSEDCFNGLFATNADGRADWVKDYTWPGVTGELKAGYVFVDGTTEKRFNTVVQIVPATVK